MKITYRLGPQAKSYEQTNPSDVDMLNSALINNKGDFLNFGLFKNMTKYHGVFIQDIKQPVVYKIIDEIIPQGLEVKELIFKGHKVERIFDNHFVQGTQGSTALVPKDSFYLAPSGGMVYEIENFDEDVLIDLDCHKRDDFDEWGREYSVYKKNDVVMIKYEKKNENNVDYELYVGFKSQSFSHSLLGDWVEKHYPYSERRGNDSRRHVYRAMSIHLDHHKRVYIGMATTEKEVLDQLFLLENHVGELEMFDENITSDITKLPSFEEPITQDVALSYSLSKNAIYKFLNRGLDHPQLRQGSYAGLPWFSDVWTRDELASLQSYLLAGEEQYVKEKLFFYLDLIDNETGTLPIILREGSNQSADSVFWLAKRIEHFIFYLDERGKLFDFLTHDDLDYFYRRLSVAFNGIIRNHWNHDKELIAVKYADSWMDTIEVNMPLDIQMQFTGFISCMGVLAGILGKKKDVEKFLDLEHGLRGNIRKQFFKDKSVLYQEPDNEKITSNIFLGYYFYKELLLQSDWEVVFDHALKHLKTDWGGIRSLSNKDSNYQDSYTGQDNKSYHQGDSWYWINNITAMALQEVNAKKYRKVIADILLSSTKDILSLGTIGFASEISSASHQEAVGCTAQLWSSALYIEMVEKLFSRTFEPSN